MLNRRQLCSGIAAWVGVGAASVRAQTLPQTIRFIVVVPPGASMDNITRLVADRLKDTLKRNTLVEYKAGGTGLVASQFLKSTEPDGSYVMFAPLAVAAFFPFLFAKLPFDPDTDLIPICDGVHIPHALTVSMGSGIQNMAQFLAAARADPLKGNIGTSSMSSVGALLIHRLRQITGIDLQLVAYKGGQPLLTDLLGNQIGAGISVISDYLAQHKAGRVRVIATGGPRRSALAPDVPTLIDSGYPDLYGVSSIGFFMRGGTPPPLVAQMSKEITDVLRSPDVRTRLLDMGAEPTGGTPEEFRRLALSERARWEPVAKAANVRME
ncbi:Bug family tripartite tricarboxylate transporter substrate binding protein [Ramlibacter sp.]|uniref:Bug family tripartite tricarboxylate transporter substrate binding protein n=1 Tax=Ramlibacter sp. TaxID=1917967 RepID=UPI0035B0D9D5